MWTKDKMIQYMAEVGLADAMSSAAEDYSIDGINVSRADLLDTVPAWFRDNGLDMGKYLDLTAASKMFDQAQKAIGVDLVELANEWADRVPSRFESDVPYYLYMMSVGHGVGFYDEPNLEKLIKEMGGDPKARWGYFESNSDGAYSALEDAGYVLESEEG